MLNLALIQYLFTEGEHEVKVAPHGNSKQREGFVRTMPSVLKKLKNVATHSAAKRALSFVDDQLGGMLTASSAGALPRGRQQVNDIRYTKEAAEFDLLYSRC